MRTSIQQLEGASGRCNQGAIRILDAGTALGNRAATAQTIPNCVKRFAPRGRHKSGLQINGYAALGATRVNTGAAQGGAAGLVQQRQQDATMDDPEKVTMVVLQDKRKLRLACFHCIDLNADVGAKPVDLCLLCHRQIPLLRNTMNFSPTGQIVNILQ